MNIKIQIDENDLERLLDNSKVEKAIGRACAFVERKAKENCDSFKEPTGTLKRSITSEVEAKSDEIIGTIYTPLEYAPYVEYGTGLFAEGGNGRKDVPWHYEDEQGEWHSTNGQKPHPFMRPALDENREEIIKIISEELAK